tara:strand:+ start:659 stop:928 length:270 start_codon:yes stop_codon:yes gene_type:complete
MKNYSLVEVSGVKYICINAKNKITNNQCNSTIFKNKKDAKLDICIFNYTNTNFKILKNIDLRFTESKYIVKKYGFFSVSKIKSNLLNNL